MTRRLGSGSLVIATHNAGKLEGNRRAAWSRMGSNACPPGRSACPNRPRPEPRFVQNALAESAGGGGGFGSGGARGPTAG